MRIQSLLEGVIKVPKETIDQVMKAVSADVISRMYNYLTTTDDDSVDEYITSFKKVFADYKRLYGKFDLFPEHDEESTSHARVYLRMTDVDPRYLENNQASKARIFPIDVTIRVSPELTGVAGEYRKRSGRTNAKMNIEVPSQEYIESVARSPELLPSLMRRISGAVEHELMHAVQDVALKQIPDNPTYYDGDGDTINDEKYYTSDIEFSPLIVSSAKEFIAYASDLRLSGVILDAADKTRLFKNYVDPTVKPPRDAVDATNVFFKTLYYKNNAKWKKAVKYFYGLVRGKF